GRYTEGSTRSPTPSEPSNTVVCIARVGSLTAAFNSVEAMRTSPQTVYSHTDWSSSSMIQCTESHGNPFLRLNVTTRPPLTWLRPVSIATQSAPLPSNRRSLTRPSAKPSTAVYDARISPSSTYVT